MFRIVLYSVLLACGVASAGEGEVSRRVEELRTKHRTLGGYLATYESRVDNKALLARIGHDFASDRIVVQVEIVVEGEKIEIRQWNDEGGNLYTFHGDRLYRTAGLREGADFLNSWNKVRSSLIPREESIAIRMISGILLEKTNFEASVGCSIGIDPFWRRKVEFTKVHEVTDDSVTFNSKGSGRLTVGRSHGLITRQEIAGEEGKERVLVLKDLRIDPGEAAISRVSAEWSTLGSGDASSGPMLAEGLAIRFQALIGDIEAGRADLAAMERHLEKESAALERFVAGIVSESPESLSARMNWEEVFSELRDGLEKEWKRNPPEGKPTLQDYLAKPVVRESAREGIVAKVLENPEARKMILLESLANQPLQSTDPAGKAAAESLEAALSKAYLEALVERKMTRHWDALE